MSDALDFLHTDHSWHGVNDEGNYGAGYWVRPGRIKELLAERGLHVVSEGQAVVNDHVLTIDPDHCHRITTGDVWCWLRLRRKEGA